MGAIAARRARHRSRSEPPPSRGTARPARLTPYLLLLPGLLWLGVFFVVPMIFLAVAVAADRGARGGLHAHLVSSAPTPTR